jgi:Zn-dependent protease
VIAVASFIGGDYSRAVPVVSSFYHIVDMQRHPTEDAVRFLIAESEIYSSFPKLVRELAKVDMIATAKRSKYASRLMPSLSSTNVTVEDGIVVTVSKIQKPHKPHSKYLLSIPVILFIATLTVVFIDGLYRSQSEFANAFIHNPILLAVVYTMSLVGILGVHEMGHMIAAKHHGIRASWPYFIPGIPGLFVPTFGAMIQIRSNMTNRNVLFDVGIAGPIAGLLVTMVVSVYGSSISVLVPADRVHDLFGDSPLMRINSSILMQTTLNIMGHGAMAGDAVLIMSPVLFAAWVGFLITFLNLLPAWQLDGGHLARSALGVRWHRVLTYSSIGILTGLGYFIMAAFVLIFSSRAPESTPLDDVSPLSKKRRVLFWVAIALAVLCAPLPSAIFRPLA